MLTLNLGNEMYSSCLFHAPDWSVVSISFVLIGWIKIENRIFGIVRLTMKQTNSGIVRLKCSKAWNNYVEFWGDHWQIALRGWGDQQYLVQSRVNF